MTTETNEMNTTSLDELIEWGVRNNMFIIGEDHLNTTPIKFEWNEPSKITGDFLVVGEDHLNTEPTKVEINR